MSIKRLYILLTLLLSSVSFVYSQERSLTDIYVEFLVNHSVLDPDFGDNAARLDEIISLIDKINTDSTLSVVKLSFCGSASPEGSLQLNRGLSYRRLKALEQYVRSRVNIPDSVIAYDASYIPWNRLRERVLEMEFDKKQEVLDIIDMDEVYVNYRGNTQIDGRVVALMELDKGVVGFRCDVINIIYKSSLENGKKQLVLTGREHFLSLKALNDRVEHHSNVALSLKRTNHLALSRKGREVLNYNYLR